jgi:hypothetical protein
MKKFTISARRVLKTKQFLDNRLEFHIFSGSLCNDSLNYRKFFHALAAWNRVKKRVTDFVFKNAITVLKGAQV